MRKTNMLSGSLKMNMQFICVIYHACVKDGWILAKLFLAFLWTETKSRTTKTQKTRPISSNLDRTRLVNKGFIIWPKYYTKEFRFCGNEAGKIGLSCPLEQQIRTQDSRYLALIWGQPYNYKKTEEIYSYQWSFPLGHRYPKDISIQGTLALVPTEKKCSQHICICYLH